VSRVGFFIMAGDLLTANIVRSAGAAMQNTGFVPSRTLGESILAVPGFFHLAMAHGGRDVHRAAILAGARLRAATAG
jgi:hypothetical protein